MLARSHHSVCGTAYYTVCYALAPQRWLFAPPIPSVRQRLSSLAPNPSAVTP
jgi:hypothetical protein